MVASVPMSGCTNCASKGGCSRRKGEERELLGRLLPELYPSLRWGDLDDAARDGVPEAESRALARRAAEATRAPTWFIPGAADESCDHVWVLCVGRRPALLELRERGAVELPEGLAPGDAVRESYLRVSLSALARVATVQEVRLTLTREGEVYALTETPLPGVYDPQLLKRTQALVECVVAADVSFLDFGLLESPPAGFRDEAGYTADFGHEPQIINYLFYPQPPRAESTLLLAAATS